MHRNFTRGSIRLSERLLLSSFSSLRALSSSLLDELSIFPEMGEVLALESEGQYKKALPPLRRIADIATSSAGPNTSVSMAAQLKLMQVLSLAGDSEQAIKIAKSAPYYNPKSGTSSSEFKPPFLHELALLYFQSCDMTSSLATADAAVDFLEKHNSSNIDISSFSRAYGMKGITSLYLGRKSEAEDFLQLAARWSTASNNEKSIPDALLKSRQLTSVSNLAFMHWYLNNLFRYVHTFVILNRN